MIITAINLRFIDAYELIVKFRLFRLLETSTLDGKLLFTLEITDTHNFSRDSILTHYYFDFR